MALNADQLIQRFLKMRYPYPKGNCKIAQRETLEVRMRKEREIRAEINKWCEKDKQEFINLLIEREQSKTARTEDAQVPKAIEATGLERWRR